LELEEKPAAAESQSLNLNLFDMEPSERPLPPGEAFFRGWRVLTEDAARLRALEQTLSMSAVSNN
jgi:hypothetical protein